MGPRHFLIWKGISVACSNLEKGESIQLERGEIAGSFVLVKLKQSEKARMADDQAQGRRRRFFLKSTSMMVPPSRTHDR